MGRALTVGEVADRLAVDPRTIRAEIDRGRLAAFRVGAQWRITPAALEEYTRPAKGREGEGCSPEQAGQPVRRVRPKTPLRSFRARARATVPLSG